MVSSWQRIDEARRLKGLQLKEMAARTGVSQNAVQKWKRGGRVSRETAERLAVVLDTTADWLLGRADALPAQSLRDDPGPVRLLEITGLTEEDSAALAASAPAGAEVSYEKLHLFSAAAPDAVAYTAILVRDYLAAKALDALVEWIGKALRERLANRPKDTIQEVRVDNYAWNEIKTEQLRELLVDRLYRHHKQQEERKVQRVAQQPSRPSHANSLPTASTPFSDPWHAEGWTGFSDAALKRFVNVALEMQDYKAASILSAELARRQHFESRGAER